MTDKTQVKWQSLSTVDTRGHTGTAIGHDKPHLVLDLS